MRIDLIELLVCPDAHEPSPLVAIAGERQGERLMTATLGCPVCSSQFALRAGVAMFGSNATAAVRSEYGRGDGDSSPDAMRLAAQLGLTASGMRVALCGGYASAADALEALTDARCVALNALDAREGSRVADMMSMDATQRLPIARGALHGLVVDESHVALLHDATRVVRAGGRIVAPAHAAVPPGCVELARDEREWVAAVQATSTAPVALQSGRARV
jgi:uncharacterized protein YbaR (Trm112 family)